MKNLSEIFKKIGNAWKSLSNVDVPENQEYRFKGELAVAQEEQASLATTHESLINSIKVGDEPKDTIRRGTTIANRTNVMKIEPVNGTTINHEISKTIIDGRDIDI